MLQTINSEMCSFGETTIRTDKPRRLLVHLRSESAAAELLTAARHLRKSDDPIIAQQVYVNEDLTPEAAKLAYEARAARQRRRRHWNQQNSTNKDQPLSSPSPAGAAATGEMSAASTLSAAASPFQPPDIPLSDTATHCFLAPKVASLKK